MTPEQIERRKAYRRAWAKKKYYSMSPEERLAFNRNCEKKRQSGQWKKNPKRVEQVRRRRQRTKALCVAYKGGKCVRCGLVDHPCVYDFHHRDPTVKEFSLAKNQAQTLNKRIKDELDKCDLLCANCHRKEHYVFV